MLNNKNFSNLTWAILLLLIITNLICTNVLSTKGSVVSEAERETLALEKENQRLFVKIEESTTLQQLEAMAQSQGYIRTKSMVFAPTTTTFASR